MSFGRFAAAFAAIAGLFLAATAPAAADDLLNNEIRLTQAFAKYGVTGKGVVVGILDRGIDWKNQDFRNADGTTRIAWIFDLGDQTGANAVNNPYGFGTIYSAAQINAALNGSGPQLAHRDASGHGTATTGICCSNGRNLPSGKYKGVAPESTIIVVKITGGAAAHGNIPAETAFNATEVQIKAGMEFVRDKAAELGMPFVILPNVGSTTGPADGTSQKSRNVEGVIGQFRPGAIFVQGSSDDGDHPNHAEGTVTQGGTTNLVVQKGAAGGSLLVDLWYRDTDRFTISIDTPTGSFGPYVGPANNTGITPVVTSDFTHGHNGSVFFFNNKRNAYFLLSGPAGTYTIKLTGATVTNGAWQAALNPARYWEAAAANNRFLSHVVAGYTIEDRATAPNAIVPNSYVYRKTWIDLDGVTRSQAAIEGAVGESWRGNGIGPTWDGRLGVDFAAPGEMNIATYAPESGYGASRSNMVQDGLGFYGVQNAVSGANPVVTGVVALMLQMNPALDAPMIKAILQRTARKDQFTGATANVRWGHGKLDVEAALDDVAQGGGGLLVSSVLPYARSVQTNTIASGFAVMINAGAQAATGCGLAMPQVGPAGTFSYQTANAGNQLIGMPNTPVTIAPGAIQNFLFTITPTVATNTELKLVFDCANTGAASSTNGVNTFLLSASPTPSPDLLAIASTLSGDGIVNITGGNGVMGVAAINIGAAGTITASVDTGSKVLPVNLFLCQTNPGTGACLSPPSPTVTFASSANATSTFSVFVQGTGNVPFDPANNRLFLRFKTGDGVTRGATNAALRTQ